MCREWERAVDVLRQDATDMIARLRRELEQHKQDERMEREAIRAELADLADRLALLEDSQ